jgi:antitoxin HicB
VLKYGDKRTTVRNLKDELKTGTYFGMLTQLGLTEKDLT